MIEINGEKNYRFSVCLSLFERDTGRTYSHRIPVFIKAEDADHIIKHNLLEDRRVLLNGRLGIEHYKETGREVESVRTTIIAERMELLPSYDSTRCGEYIGPCAAGHFGKIE